MRGKSKCCVNTTESALMALLTDCAIFRRIMENGQERVEVEEDGQLKSVSINGEWGFWQEALDPRGSYLPWSGASGRRVSGG